MPGRKRRKVSRATRAKIARGLRAMYELRRLQTEGLRENVEIAIQEGKKLRGIGKSKYRGRFVSHEYARRYPWLVVADEDRVEWEITLKYAKTKENRAVGQTTRITAPANVSRDAILAAYYRAGIGHPEPGFEYHFVNWQAPLQERTAQLTFWTHKYATVEDGLQVPGFAGLYHGADVRAERVAG